MTYRPLASWQVLNSKVIVDRRWIEVHEEHLRLPSGHEIQEFHRIVSPSWSAALCVTEDDQVVLVRQYRRGIAAESLELPAGVIEPGESPLAAAQRELAEEAGYEADEWYPIVTVATEPSRHTVYAHFFCARGARSLGRRAPEESEDINVVTVPRAQVVELCASGGIVHGVHVGAVLLAERRGLLAKEVAKSSPDAP